MTILLQETDNFPEQIKGIPNNYNFEIRKTLRTIKKIGAKKVTLQFPDGLLSYAPMIIETINFYTGAECIVMNDVVYGACCADDSYGGSDLLVHYGHSCLVPVSAMETRVLYVFVEIRIDIGHLERLITDNFSGTIGLIGTIQYNSCVNRLRRVINSKAMCKCSENKYSNSSNVNKCSNSSSENKCTGSLHIITPQSRPLSQGEVLGCTSPIIKGVENVIYVGDGRFHLESAMIRNPTLSFYKYCPYDRKLTREFYSYSEMVAVRREEVKKALKGKNFGIILGTLGKQGNRKILENVYKYLKGGNYKIYKIVVDEINEEILNRFPFIDAFIQISCPRLSIDWGSNYKKPLLSPYEILCNNIGGEDGYAMDYYTGEGDMPWKNYSNGVYRI